MVAGGSVEAISPTKYYMVELSKVDVVEPGGPAYAKLRKEFGAEFFDVQTGALNRTKLGDLVFGDVERVLETVACLKCGCKFVSVLFGILSFMFMSFCILLKHVILECSGTFYSVCIKKQVCSMESKK
uniref:FtsJ domain-containing protein n=1 Tax=Angiostrongylus cantonensis TaxID=6313 RepID=A0A0K0DPU8_ANGCA